MKAFITGGAGFIGSHLTEALLEQGHEVFILDDLSTGSAENFRPFKTNPKFHYHIASFMDVPLVNELIDCADVTYHLAAAVGVKLIVESPVHTIETNVRGTEIVLAAAAKKQKPVFVASTSEVYGKSTEFPFREEGDLVMGATSKGRWSYACSKAIDEFLALAYFREKKLPTVVGRLFNTVGPRQTARYGMVLPTFARQALANEAITVYGDGTQSRCFCHVKDTVRALIGLMQNDKSYGEVFNIGSTREISIEGLASLVKEQAGSTSAITKIPYAEAYAEGFEDMMRRVPSIEKIKNHIGWEPRFALEEIVRDVITSVA
jgi:UDP-glucose 4-epimerase